jgi:hypothetical protein
MLERFFRRRHACRGGPVEGDGQDEHEALDAVGLLPLGFGAAEAARLKITAHGFDAPAPAVIEEAALGGRIGPGDDPGLVVPCLRQDTDMGLEACFSKPDRQQRRPLRLGRLAGGDLAAVVMQDEVVL